MRRPPSYYHQPTFEIRSRGLLFANAWEIQRPTQLETLVAFRCSGATPAPALRALVVTCPKRLIERNLFLENMSLEALRPNSENAVPRWASLDSVGTLTRGDVVTVELLDGHSAIGWSLVVNYREIIE